MSATPDTAAVPGASCHWDGAPGWPRPRLVHSLQPGGPALPATYVQSDPTDATSAGPARLQHTYTEFRCQVCGEAVLAVDDVGWVLEPVANMGGACCTRCMYLALRACPHLAESPDAWRLHAVTDPPAYRWHVVDGATDGHVAVDASRSTAYAYDAFVEHHRTWRRAQASSSPDDDG